jgi:nucleoside-diphosphate-sugar epimerase
MRLALFGATGGIGGHLLNWAVDAGHPVHVLARDAAAVPARLVNDPLTGHYQVRPQYPPPGLTKISRADVAHFMIGALTDSSYLHQTPALAY